MTSSFATRPDPSEVAPYHRPYVDRVGDGDILATLADQAASISEIGVLAAADPARGDFRYQPDKWSFKEVLGHCIDTERVFSYRALHVARGDEQALVGFDQDAWVAAGAFDTRVLPDLIEEWVALRADTVRLLGSLPQAAWTLTGMADGRPVSVRGLAWLSAGHADHHLSVLRERYL